MRVRVRWPYDRALGSGHGTFVGKVTERDEWIRVMNAGNMLHMPLFTTGLEIERA
jgi:hypothetical protein